jgi:integrase
MLRKLDYLDEYFGDFKVTEVTGPDMKMRLAEQEEWSAVTRNKTLSYWKAAYNVAKTDLGLISDNPLDDTKFFAIKPHDLVVLTPEQAEKWLRAADPTVIPSLAIGLFAGLRRSERLLLNWENINLSKSKIRVWAKVSKTGEYREVPIQSNLAEWLRPYAKDSGKVIEISAGAHDSLIRKAKAATGLINGEEEELQNYFRRSFVSYYSAVTPNLQDVLDAAGHGFEHYKKNYRAKVELEDAQRYWNIKPTTQQERS